MFDLQSGANMSITRTNPLLDELVVGFSWNTIATNGPEVELVPSAIVVDANNKVLNDDYFVFFNQLATPDDAVRYIEGDDDEQIEVTLSRIPDVVSKVVFIVYVNPDLRKPGTFNAVKDSSIKVYDREMNVITQFSLPRNNDDNTAVIYGELYRYKNEWKFRAGGQGYSTGIKGVAADFKVQL